MGQVSEGKEMSVYDLLIVQRNHYSTNRLQNTKDIGT